MSTETSMPVVTGITPEEYLAQEELAETRSEYVSGEIIPMTGASLRHNAIIGNLHFSIRTTLGADDFRTFLTDLKTKTNRESYRYPDVIVMRPPAEFDKGRTHVITNPLVIFEVLSPSTEADDRGEKFADYRTIDSLQAYVLVAQHQRSVECFTRQPDGSWLLTVVTEGEIEIPPLNCSIKLDDVYHQVDFDEKAASV